MPVHVASTENKRQETPELFVSKLVYNKLKPFTYFDYSLMSVIANVNKLIYIFFKLRTIKLHNDNIECMRYLYAISGRQL